MGTLFCLMHRDTAKEKLFADRGKQDGIKNMETVSPLFIPVLSINFHMPSSTAETARL